MAKGTKYRGALIYFNGRFAMINLEKGHPLEEHMINVQEIFSRRRLDLLLEDLLYLWSFDQRKDGGTQG